MGLLILKVIVSFSTIYVPAACYQRLVMYWCIVAFVETKRDAGLPFALRWFRLFLLLLRHRPMTSPVTFSLDVVVGCNSTFVNLIFSHLETDNTSLWDICMAILTVAYDDLVRSYQCCDVRRIFVMKYCLRSTTFKCQMTKRTAQSMRGSIFIRHSIKSHSLTLPTHCKINIK